MNTQSILRRPVLTEKTTWGIDKLGAYVFEVDRGANKLEIKKAIEEHFNVKVVKVNVRVKKGKFKRFGQSTGYGRDRKEAIVTLRAGEKLDIY